MKKSLFAAAALIALPMAAQAQSPAPGFYIGAEGGLNWLLNTNVTAVTSTSGGALNTVQVTPQTGWMAGGVIGYDFVGPRVELEGLPTAIPERRCARKRRGHIARWKRTPVEALAGGSHRGCTLDGLGAGGGRHGRLDGGQRSGHGSAGRSRGHGKASVRPRGLR